MSNNMDLGANWEGLIKMLLQRLDMPTKEDINALHNRLDTLEQLIAQKQPCAKKQTVVQPGKRRNASTTVLEIIANYPEGTNFKTIKAATGFDDKKLRNIIFRLDKIGRIKRVRRGIYKTI
jgi:predicted Rossmann fold nucleotide-binding protein DprA/Smf involved in DNA uptake